MKPIAQQQAWRVFMATLILAGGAWYTATHQPKVGVVVTSPSIRTCPVLTLPEQLAAADLVLEAMVEMVVPSETNAEVYFRPDRVYKGIPARPMRIFARPINSLVTTQRQEYAQVSIHGVVENEISFASDQPPYLLFLQKKGEGYVTSRCDGSRLLGNGLTAEERSVIDPQSVIQ